MEPIFGPLSELRYQFRFHLHPPEILQWSRKVRIIELWFQLYAKNWSCQATEDGDNDFQPNVLVDHSRWLSWSATDADFRHNRTLYSKSTWGLFGRRVQVDSWWADKQALQNWKWKVMKKILINGLCQKANQRSLKLESQTKNKIVAPPRLRESRLRGRIRLRQITGDDWEESEWVETWVSIILLNKFGKYLFWSKIKVEIITKNSYLFIENIKKFGRWDSNNTWTIGMKLKFEFSN